MGMDAKEFRVFVWRMARFSLNSCFRLAQKYPIVSGALLIFLVLYLFLPSVFYLLIYTFPVVVCTAVFIRFYLSTRRTQLQTAGKDDEKKGDRMMPSVQSKSIPAEHIVRKDGDSSIEAQALFPGAVEEKTEASSLQETKMVSSISPDSIGRAAGAAENPKGTVEKKEINSLNPVESSRNVATLDEASSGPDLKPIDGSDEQATKSRVGISEAELESSDSEEAPDGAKKPVEWTEDDQKNLMDLGFSEIERNKRLESLIARRRARKLFKMNTEKCLIDMNVAPPPIAHLLVARNSPFEFPNICYEQMPGSAPSVLLPNRNPFDLPYDPLEEKPDLMTDSFQQEFMTAPQKETLFCRHESFCLGAPIFAPDGMHEHPGYSLFKRPSDKRDDDGQQVENLSQVRGTLRRNLSATDLVTDEEHIKNQPGPNSETGSSKVELNTEEENGHNVNSSIGNGTETELKPNESESPHSSSEDGESNFRVNRAKTSENQNLQPTAFKFPDLPSPVQNSCPLPKARALNELSYDSSSSAIDSARSRDYSFYPNRGNWHTPTNSIASDMQVEVSEVGSPPLTADGTASSDDGDSLTYDGDVEKDINSDSDEMCGLSPHAPGVEELETALREANKVIHEDVKRRLSGNRKESHGTKASSVLPLPSPTNMPRRKDRSRSASFDRLFPGDACQVNDKVGTRPSNDVDATSTEVSQRDMKPVEDSTPITRPEVLMEKPQEQLNHSEKPASKTDISQSVDDSAHTCNDGKILKSSEDWNGGYKNSAVDNMPKPTEECNSESSTCIEKKSTGTPENPTEEVNINHNAEKNPVVHVDDHIEDLKRVADNEGNSEKPAESVAIQNMPRSVQGQEQEGTTSTSGSIERQNASKAGISIAIQTTSHPATPNIQIEYVDEQANAPSSSSSSPKSVLPDGNSVDLGLSPDFNQQMLNDSSVSVTDGNMARNEPLEANLAHDSVLTEPQSGGREAMASMISPFIDGNSGTSMEASNTLEKTTKSTEHVLNDKEAEDPKPTRDLHGESETLILSEAAAEFSEPAKDINNRAVGQSEGTASVRHSEHEESVEQTKPEEEPSLKFAALAIEEKGSTDPQEELSGAADTESNNIRDPAVDDKENVDRLKSIDGENGEAQHPSRQETVRQTDTAQDGSELSGFSSTSEENNNSSSNNRFEDFVNVIRHLQDHLIDVMSPTAAAAGGNSEISKNFGFADGASTGLNPSKPEAERDRIDVYNADGEQERLDPTVQDH